MILRHSVEGFQELDRELPGAALPQRAQACSTERQKGEQQVLWGRHPAERHFPALLMSPELELSPDAFPRTTQLCATGKY